jgi:Tfp pilus assembly protein PilZ
MSLSSNPRAAAEGDTGTRDWCPVCCSIIDGAHRCPGPLLATGHERHGWRVHVETPYGMLAFGASLKFAGSTPQEAERRAIEFIDRHCDSKGYRRRDQLDAVEVHSFAAEAERATTTRAKQASPRKLCALPVRFGEARAVRPGTTMNISRDGMFIGTTVPLDAGESVRIHLDVEGYSLPLRGVVMWNRRRKERGRPLGMGVRLIDPVPSYPQLVEQLI